MSGQISKYGWTGIDWSFANENNELHDTFYVADSTQVKSVLNILFGNSDGGPRVPILPLEHPVFKGFYVHDVNVLPVHEKAVQCNDNGQGDWFNSLNNPATIQGGLKYHCIFRPLCTSGNYTNVSEQQLDYSSQIMSVISNAPSQDQNNCLVWKPIPPATQGSPCTNLRGIMKVVPKVDFFLKRLFLSHIPNLQDFIGCVNDADWTMMDQDAGSQISWPKHTVLFTGMPVVRRFRFDNTPTFDVTLKFSAMTLKDKLEDGTVDYVTWQRLYHVDLACWHEVLRKDGGDNLYPATDFTALQNLVG